MKSALGSTLLISLGIAASVYPTGATTLPAFAYATAFTCLNSTSGFNSKFEPKTEGTAWTETFSGVGSGTISGSTSTATELDTSVITAVYGSKPTSRGPAANAYANNITATTTGPNSDGSFTLTATTWSGTVTAGPNKGLTFSATTAGYSLKVWMGSNGVFVQGITTPVVQTITLSNNTKYERICTTMSTTTSPLQ